MSIRVGFHVSIAGGIQNSISNAVEIGCTAFQIFTRSPRQWRSKDLVVEKSLNSFTSELTRCSQLGIEYLVIHLGSHKEQGRDNGIKQLLKSCGEAVDNYKSTFKRKLDVTILLENSAGQKGSMGSKLEELEEILDKLSSKTFCVCLDT